MGLKVRDIMIRDVITLKEEESLLLAQDIMDLARLRHLPVLKGEVLVGLVTHRDLLRASISSMVGLTAIEDEAVKQRIHVRDVMRRDVESIGPDAPAADAARQLLNHKYGCLPVVDADQKLLGILTEADFVKIALKALES